MKFGYPRRGLEGEFSTFRLGARTAAKLQPGDEVELVDSRSLKVLKRAAVLSVRVGDLTEMAKLYAHTAHNWKGSPPDERAALLVASMKKRYPPGRCDDHSICSVIHLKEI